MFLAPEAEPTFRQHRLTGYDVPPMHARVELSILAGCMVTECWSVVTYYNILMSTGAPIPFLSNKQGQLRVHELAKDRIGMFNYYSF